MDSAVDLTAFRNPERADRILKRLKNEITRPWVIMEMCGGQTHALMQSGIDQLLASQIEFIHGPGCPVCVTSLALVDEAIALAKLPNVILTTYGDMLRVPGSAGNLFAARAQGCDIRVVYAALDALKIARENPDKEVVFFGIGFETTAPANGISILQAYRTGIRNYSVLVSQVCVPPTLEMILSSPQNRVQGFLAAGHVCAVMGTSEYIPISEKYHVPICVTGFEPIDLLAGIETVVRDLEAGCWSVSNAYSRGVPAAGTAGALAIIHELFEPCDRDWRGIGIIPDSGWKLKDKYSAYDAEKKFGVTATETHESDVCIAGAILRGLKTPPECPAFAASCTPEHPLGAAMVSGEGTCSAYYRYRRNHDRA